jgi:hypothetical protein
MTASNWHCCLRNTAPCKEGFFRAHTGRPQIAAMLQRFHDTGRDVALVQLDFTAERIKRVLERAAATQNRLPKAQAHLARFSAG